MVDRSHGTTEVRKNDEKAESVDCFLFFRGQLLVCLAVLMRTDGACDEKESLLSLFEVTADSPWPVRTTW